MSHFLKDYMVKWGFNILIWLSCISLTIYGLFEVGKDFGRGFYPTLLINIIKTLCIGISYMILNYDSEINIDDGCPGELDKKITTNQTNIVYLIIASVMMLLSTMSTELKVSNLGALVLRQAILMIISHIITHPLLIIQNPKQCVSLWEAYWDNYYIGSIWFTITVNCLASVARFITLIGGYGIWLITDWEEYNNSNMHDLESLLYAYLISIPIPILGYFAITIIASPVMLFSGWNILATGIKPSIEFSFSFDPFSNDVFVTITTITNIIADSFILIANMFLLVYTK